LRGELATIKRRSTTIGQRFRRAHDDSAVHDVNRLLAERNQLDGAFRHETICETSNGIGSPQLDELPAIGRVWLA
jgi:hypothetical protein